MRKIDKHAEPVQLLEWKRINAATPENLDYGNMPKEPIRQALVEEQFFLCAYTMKRLPQPPDGEQSDWSYGQSCHIEHFLPQSKYTNGEDIAYRNMLACYPPSHAQRHCAFGAIYKADHDPGQVPIMNPVFDLPETHLRFRQNGEVEGISELGRNTVKVLNLNHPQLKEERYRTILGSLQPRGKQISGKRAQELAQQVCTPEAGALAVHCIAIAQVLRRYAEKAKARAARTKNEKAQ